MGNQKSSMVYSKPLTPDLQTETGIYRNPLSIDSQELTHNFNPNILTLQDAFLESVKNHKSKPFLGSRNKDGLYIFKTYQEVYDIALTLGSGMINNEMVPVLSEFRDYKIQFVGIFAKNREEYMICDLACILFGFTSVALYDTFGVDSLELILKETNMKTIFCSKETLEAMNKLIYFSQLKHIVCFDNFTDVLNLEKFKKHNIEIYNFSDIVVKGNKNPKKNEKIKPETFYTLSYTSGTTGIPKGAMLSHKNFISVLAGLKQNIKLKPEDIHLSYLPMAHVFEKIIVSLCVSEGVAIGFYSGDVLKLKDDLQSLHPTIFCSVPRLYNKFYEVIKMTIDKFEGFKAFLVKRAIASKLNSLKSRNSFTHGIYDRVVFKKMRQTFGGHVRLMATGSAPISSDVLDFLKIANSCPLIEGYGQTESTGVSFLTSLEDTQSGHIGGPLMNTEFKLINVPEMDYLVNNKENPPMGEILIRGPGVFTGYYKDEKRTKEVLDENGWLRTGDIGFLMANGGLKIIDRKKNIFKLSQGEFVSAEKIENIYQTSRIVSEIFVYGDSFESFIVAIVVPDRSYLIKLAEGLKIKGKFQELVRDRLVNEGVLKELQLFAKNYGLKSFEIVKGIYLEEDSFSKKDLITSTFKLKRFLAREIYAKEIKLIYSKSKKN